MSVTYKADPANPSTFGGTSLAGIQSFTLTRTADEVLLNADGTPYSQGAFYDNLSYTATVELTENFKTAKIGDSGILILKAKPRVNGTGVAVGVLTFTSAAASAIVSDVSHTVSHGGTSACTITFRIISIDGGISDPLTVA